jgi:hypothetical protein
MLKYILVVIVGCMGCATTYNGQKAENQQTQQMTLGVAQKTIRKGLDQATIATGMGSPNIVTRDKDGNETWIYDKISSDVSYSASDSYGTLLIIGGSNSKGSSSSSQKTLTIVIKFDENHLVDSFSYHSSKF